jgi:hypothetical protein
MANEPHDVLLVLLREEPALLDTLVEKVTGVRLPRGLKSSDATARFAKPAEVRLDLVLRSGRRRWAIVEIQRAIDPKKRRRWLLAASLLFDQTGALGDVIVITARRAVARWAMRVAYARTQLGTELRLKPVVLYLADKDGAALLDEQHPELALFAAWAMQHRHGREAQRVVERALELTDRLPRALRTAQQRAILSVLSERMLARLREASMNPDKIPETPAARKTRLFLEAQGRKKGRVEGRAKGTQLALLTLLRARGIPPSTEDEARIRACTDSAMLEQWIERAVTASSVREVLGPKTAAPSARRRATGRSRSTSSSRS